ncbi:uncharacterized protein LOC124460442 [Drosophila willistoni]|uniref:uncharacterized protein LOC6648765 n=1 Tax=Drosophila willistoni TaxID=7260 RepID=UPI001F07ADF4|nr:uncharacterized protein LOC6648765 [Drosophila willistoni]XP_046867189.1 uncharacterized protein LOC124460442 [Drosophila willistoni]
MMVVTSSSFWLAWLFLMCVGIAFCTRQASQVYKQRNVAKEEESERFEGRKPQRDDGGEETAAKTEKGKAVAMKMFNRDAVLRPQQPNDIEGSPITTRQRDQDKRNKSRYNSNSNSNSDNNHTNDVKLEEDDKARQMRWVENVCGFIKRPLVDFIYEQAMAARLQKLQELHVANPAQLARPPRGPPGPTGPPLPLPSSGHSMRPTRSLRRKRQPKMRTKTGVVSRAKDTVTAKELYNLKDQLVKILNEGILSANDNRMDALSKRRDRHGDNASSCSCY